MPRVKDATTMSVPEMAKLLGIKKTDSYWLVHQNYFKTTIIAGKMRVDKASFEKWYANQTHHQKVNGEQPGKNICEKTYTIRELSESLGICKECVVEAMRKHHIRMITVNGQFRVNRKDFDAWYVSQSHYRNQQDRERDKALKDVSLTVPEIARMLGVDSWTAWFRIAKDPNNHLDMIRVADRPRITKESFETWYANQSQYRIVEDTRQGTPAALTYEKSLERLKGLSVNGDEAISPQEAGKLLNMDTKALYRWIEYGELPSKKIGKYIRIKVEDLIYWIEQHKGMNIQQEV